MPKLSEGQAPLDLGEWRLWPCYLDTIEAVCDADFARAHGAGREDHFVVNGRFYYHPEGRAGRIPPVGPLTGRGYTLGPIH